MYVRYYVLGMVRTRVEYVIVQRAGRALSVMFPLTIASLPIVLDEECVSLVTVNATLDGKGRSAMRVWYLLNFSCSLNNI